MNTVDARWWCLAGGFAGLDTSAAGAAAAPQRCCKGADAAAAAGPGCGCSEGCAVPAGGGGAECSGGWTPGGAASCDGSMFVWSESGKEDGRVVMLVGTVGSEAAAQNMLWVDETCGP